MKRDKLLFKVGDEIIIEESIDLTINQINILKIYITKEIGCFIDEIEVEHYQSDIKEELSNLDCCSYGLIFCDKYPDEIQGLKLDFEIGSNEHLDAINNGTIENYLKFFI
jgi:hypothetical protein